MQQLRARLTPIAESHGTVLITGESGSGKEVAARCIHRMSPRADQPFLALNCAALMLTASFTSHSSLSCLHRESVSKTSRNIQAVTGMIMPDSSAAGMNWSGEMAP